MRGLVAPDTRAEIVRTHVTTWREMHCERLDPGKRRWSQLAVTSPTRTSIRSSSQSARRHDRRVSR